MKHCGRIQQKADKPYRPNLLIHLSKLLKQPILEMAMRLHLALIWGVLLSSGCAETMVGVRATTLYGTVDNLYYAQAINNLAMMQANPARLPSFSVPTQGATTVARTSQGTYSPIWNFITDSSSVFLGRWLLASHQAQFQGSNQASETWQAAPLANPDLINILKFAYHRTLGIIDPEGDALLELFFETHKSRFNYKQAFQPGWYGVGRKHDVPKHACQVGHCGKTYVWVMPENLEALSRFTLAVLDIATLSSTAPTVLPPAAAAEMLKIDPDSLPNDRSKRIHERLLLQLETVPFLQPRTIPMMPYPAPPRP